jgi:hypothetical protein
MLITDWGQVLRRAWSVRLMVIAALLSGAEAALPFAHQLGWLDFLPGGTFALLSFIVVAGAFIARFVAQRGINGR